MRRKSRLEEKYWQLWRKEGFVALWKKKDELYRESQTSKISRKRVRRIEREIKAIDFVIVRTTDWFSVDLRKYIEKRREGNEQKITRS